MPGNRPAGTPSHGAVVGLRRPVDMWCPDRSVKPRGSPRRRISRHFIEGKVALNSFGSQSFAN